MRYIKTFEGLFDFLKKGKDPEKSAKEACSEITDEIVDSMLEIFDKYNISQIPQEENERILSLPANCYLGGSERCRSTQTNQTDLYWYYNYTDDVKIDRGRVIFNGGIIKCGIEVVQCDFFYGRKNYLEASEKLHLDLVSDIKEIIPVISGRVDIDVNFKEEKSRIYWDMVPGNFGIEQGHRRSKIIINFPVYDNETPLEFFHGHPYQRKTIQ